MDLSHSRDFVNIDVVKKTSVYVKDLLMFIPGQTRLHHSSTTDIWFSDS